MLYTVIEYRVMTLGEAINRRIHRHAMPGGDDRLKLRGSDLVFLRIITLKSVSKPFPQAALHKLARLLPNKFTHPIFTRGVN